MLLALPEPILVHWRTFQLDIKLVAKIGASRRVLTHGKYSSYRHIPSLWSDSCVTIAPKNLRIRENAHNAFNPCPLLVAGDSLLVTFSCGRRIT